MNAETVAKNINALRYHPGMDPSLAPSHGDNLTRSLLKINKILFAGPWANCALSSGWTGTLQARVNGDRIEFMGKMSNPTPLTTTARVVAILPSSVVKVAANRMVMAPGGTAINPACSVGLIFDTGGNINAAAFNNSDNATIVWFDGISVPL